MTGDDSPPVLAHENVHARQCAELGPLRYRLRNLTDLRASEERFRLVVETARDYAIGTLASATTPARFMNVGTAKRSSSAMSRVMTGSPALIE